MRGYGRGFARDRRGVVAIEFALLTPLLMVLLMGMFEVVSLVRVNLKLSHTANGLAKVIAQQQPPPAGPTQASTLTQAQVTDYCTGAGYELAPYAKAYLSAAVVSLTSANGGTPTKDWESDSGCPTHASAYAGAAIAGAGSYNLTPNAGDRVIVVRTTYTYTPVLHYVLGSSWTLTQTAFARPRNSAGVACPDCS